MVGDVVVAMHVTGDGVMVACAIWDGMAAAEGDACGGEGREAREI